MYVNQRSTKKKARPYLEHGGPPSSMPTHWRRRMMQLRHVTAHAAKTATEKERSPAGTAKPTGMLSEYQSKPARYLVFRAGRRSP